MNNHFSDSIMLGAIAGDIAGSIYEFCNIDYCIPPEKLISETCGYTDDTVMTCAVAEGLCNALSKIEDSEIISSIYDDLISAELVRALVQNGRKYEKVGYGPSFYQWIWSDLHSPYNSWGNGSAMRASYAGWVAKTLQEAEHLAMLTAAVTHNHPEGIKGAIAVAGSIFILRNNGSKEDIIKYIKRFYSIDFTLDEIRPSYTFDVSCQGSVPQAIEAFLEGNNFEDVISKAISIGGDSDTIAAIAGSIAEAYYPMLNSTREKILLKLDNTLKSVLDNAIAFAKKRTNINY